MGGVDWIEDSLALRAKIQSIIDQEGDDEEEAMASKLSEAQVMLTEMILKYSRSRSHTRFRGYDLADVSCINSLENLVKDPVVLSNGKILARWMVESWLEQHNRTDPLTQETITDTLISYKVVRDMIDHLCEKRRVDPTISSLRSMGWHFLKGDDLVEFLVLMHMLLSGTVVEQKIAMKQLREEIETKNDFERLFRENKECMALAGRFFLGKGKKLVREANSNDD